MVRLRLWVVLVALGLVACGGVRPAEFAASDANSVTADAVPSATEAVASAIRATPSASEAANAATATPPPATRHSPLATATATATRHSPPATPTPDPYAPLTIDALAAREYGGGLIEIVDTLETTEAFARYLIKYPSDGLTIYGYMNVPHEGDNFPVALVLHGYIDPDEYETVAYTQRCV